MQPAHRLLSAFALAALSASSLASTGIYTSSASFLANVEPGAYTETFDGLAQPPAGAASFSDGTFTYTVSAPSDLYASGEFIGTSLPDEALTITFTSGNVSAVGGNFYATNISDEFQPVSMTLTLSDGTIETFAPSSASESYRGFTSNLAFTSLVISAPGAALYAGVDNLTVGVASAVPEPATWVMTGLGLAALLLRRRAA